MTAECGCIQLHSQKVHSSVHSASGLHGSLYTIKSTEAVCICFSKQCTATKFWNFHFWLILHFHFHN